MSNLQIVSAVERDSGDYECQLTGDHTDHVAEDLVLNQKLEINVFDKEKSLTEEDESSGRLKGREKTSKAESVLASFVQNDHLQQAEEEKSGRRRARQERKSDERQTTFQRSSGSRLGLSSLGTFVALLLCSVTSVL